MIGAQRRARKRKAREGKKGTIADVFSGGLWVYWSSGIDWLIGLWSWAACGTLLGVWASFGEWDACLTSVFSGLLAVAAAWLQGAASVSAGLDRGAMPGALTAVSWTSGRVPEGLAGQLLRSHSTVQGGGVET